MHPKAGDIFDTSLVDDESMKLLLTLGDPNKLKKNIPVIYPRDEVQLREYLSGTAVGEKELFKWHANNGDKNAEPKVQYLKKVEVRELLPTLKSNEVKRR